MTRNPDRVVERMAWTVLDTASPAPVMIVWRSVDSAKRQVEHDCELVGTHGIAFDWREKVGDA